MKNKTKLQTKLVDQNASITLKTEAFSKVVQHSTNVSSYSWLAKNSYPYFFNEILFFFLSSQNVLANLEVKWHLKIHYSLCLNFLLDGFVLLTAFFRAPVSSSLASESH